MTGVLAPPAPDSPGRTRRRLVPPPALRRRPAAGVLVGIGLSALGLVVPWLGYELGAPRSAWGIDAAVSWSPALSHATYGEIAGSCLVLLVVSLVRRPDRPARRTLAAGIVLTGSAVYFVVALRLIGGNLLEGVVLDGDAFQSINLHFGLGPTPSGLPLSLLGHGVGPTSLSVLGAVRPGWYLSALGGVTLIGASRRPPTAPTGPRRAAGRRTTTRAAWLAGVLVGALAVSSVVGALVGQLAMGRARADVTSGRDAPALRLVAEARAWDWGLRADPSTVVTEGLAETGMGRLGAASDLARATSLAGGVQQLMLYEEAWDQGRGQGAVRAAVAAYLDRRIPPDFLASFAPYFPADPAVAFAEGTVAFESGHYAEAVAGFQRVLHLTSAGWTSSAAYTYIAVAEDRLGHLNAFRADIIRAHELDQSLSNVFASELSAGLYLPGSL